MSMFERNSKRPSDPTTMNLQLSSINSVLSSDHYLSNLPGSAMTPRVFAT
jgi:hypothetical protein